jgi:hypothetical protein
MKKLRILVGCEYSGVVRPVTHRTAGTTLPGGCQGCSRLPLGLDDCSPVMPALVSLRGTALPGKTDGRAAAIGNQLFHDVGKVRYPSYCYREPCLYHVNDMAQAGSGDTPLAVWTPGNQSNVSMAEGITVTCSY